MDIAAWTFFDLHCTQKTARPAVTNIHAKESDALHEYRPESICGPTLDLDSCTLPTLFLDL